MKTINNELIRSFNPCYDPSTKGIPDDETLTVLEWVEKYRGVVPASDILWLLLRNEFLSDKQLRLFSVWCAREALKLVENPDQRSIDACDVAERYANGLASKEELAAAAKTSEAAWAAARTAEAAWAALGAAMASETAWAADTSALGAARAAAGAAALAADTSALGAARAAAWAADTSALGVARATQLNKLLTYFK